MFEYALSLTLVVLGTVIIARGRGLWPVLGAADLVVGFAGLVPYS